MFSTYIFAHLIGSWVGDIDNASCQLCLQVVDKSSLKSLSLVEDIILISSTWQSKQKTEVTVSLQSRTKSLSVSTLGLVMKI